MKTVAIIQARMGSTRLPGKVLKKVQNKTLLEYQIERLKRCLSLDEIVIATTNKDIDEPIVELCKKLDVHYFRGPENDVLSRYYQAAVSFDVDTIVRITSDCPIIDPEVIDEVVNIFNIKFPKYDYVSNTLERTFPRGMDTEVFSFKSLEKSYNRAKKESFREHVTPYIYCNPNLFSIYSHTSSINLSAYRLTVDTQEDFQLIYEILTRLYQKNNNFTLQDVIELMQEHPYLLALNSHIEQKQYDF